MYIYVSMYHISCTPCISLYLCNIFYYFFLKCGFPMSSAKIRSPLNQLLCVKMLYKSIQNCPCSNPLLKNYYDCDCCKVFRCPQPNFGPIFDIVSDYFLMPFSDVLSQNMVPIKSATL